MAEVEKSKKKGGKGKVVLIVVVVVVALAVIAGMGGNGKSGSDAQAVSGDAQASAGTQQTASEPAEKFPVSDEEVDTSNPYLYQISGTLTNNSGKDCSYVQVTYVLSDADGHQVGNAYANAPELKAGGTWKFNASGTVDPEDVASYELSEVTGY